MWVFTPEGFFSVVKDRLDETRVIVRARHRPHLENLKRSMNFTTKITTLKGADYPFRMRMNRHAWASVVSMMAQEIHYTNFKDCAAQQEKSHNVDGRYVDLLHDIWRASRKAYTQ